MRRETAENPPPAYPTDIARKGVQGDVALQLTVSNDGSVYSVLVLGGEGPLAKAAVKAVKKWTFEPCLYFGLPMSYKRDFALRFTLPDKVEDVSNQLPQTQESDRARIEPAVAERMVVRMVKPEYPRDAEIALIQGRVSVRVIIDKTGKVMKVIPITGHPMLLPALVEAVRKWQYKPHEVNGEAVEWETAVTWKFGQ